MLEGTVRVRHLEGRVHGRSAPPPRL